MGCKRDLFNIPLNSPLVSWTSMVIELNELAVYIVNVNKTDNNTW